MRRALASVLVALLGTGCTLYLDGRDDDPSDPGPADGGGAPDPGGCPEANIGCGPGRRCEVQCEPAGSTSCAYPCQPTCVVVDGCAGVDCGAERVCVEHCSRECQGMAQLCRVACELPADLTACERATSEAACQAQAGCVPVYRGVDCACPGFQCSCAERGTAYLRCAAGE